jgi:DNA-binding transcriptional MerR regulator
MNTFTIKDLESLSGIKAHTIRIWEQRYSFLKPQRTGSNIRYYSNDELIRLLNIALLNKYGYKISHIDKMPHSEIQQKLMSLSSAEANAERSVNQLIELMVTMDIFQFEKQLDIHIEGKGLDKTITQVLFPFLEKIGILWVTAHINPAQEHLVSNVIRQKLIMGIDVAKPVTVSERSILLFLPEGEHHELALLYLHYLLKTKGVRVYYIGSNVPLKDLSFIIKHKSPDIIYSHITAPSRGFNLDRFFSFISTQLTDSKFVIGGSYISGYAKPVPSNIQLARSTHEVIMQCNTVLFK